MRSDSECCIARPMKVKALRMDSSGFGRAEQPADGTGYRRWRSLYPVQRARVDGFAAISASRRGTGLPVRSSRVSLSVGAGD